MLKRKRKKRKGKQLVYFQSIQRGTLPSSIHPFLFLILISNLWLSLLSKPQPRPLRIKNHILILQKHIPEDGKLHPGVTLDSTKTHRPVLGYRGHLYVFPGRNCFIAVAVLVTLTTR